MSTYYAPSEKIDACSLFDGRLEKFGIREHVCVDTTHARRWLTDGRNYLWVNINDAGLVDSFVRRGVNAPGKILDAIVDLFNTAIFSEYEPQFWGFETQEEWDAAMKKIADENQERFYLEIMNYVRGEPTNIPPETIGMIQAGIAKELVEEDPALLRPENKDRLMCKIDSIYQRDHTVTITLDPVNRAFADMIATHEDDLPSG